MKHEIEITEDMIDRASGFMGLPGNPMDERPSAVIHREFVRNLLTAALRPPPILTRRYTDTPREERRNHIRDVAEMVGEAHYGAEADRVYNIGKVTSMTMGLAPNAPWPFQTSGDISRPPNPKPEADIPVSEGMIEVGRDAGIAVGARVIKTGSVEDVAAAVYRAMERKRREESP